MSTLRGPAQLAILQGAFCGPTYNLTSRWGFLFFGPGVFDRWRVELLDCGTMGVYANFHENVLFEDWRIEALVGLQKRATTEVYLFLAKMVSE